MSQSESLILDLVVLLNRGEKNKKDVALILGVSVRTVERYLREYRKNGALFVQHGNRGKKPKNKSANLHREKICRLVQTKYFDCNCVHASELLIEREDLRVHPETLRRWLSEINFVKKAKQRRRPKHRRERMKQVGIMVQFDGSHHRWFGGVESVLIAGIDDADNEVVWGGFFESEDTLSCLEVLKNWVRRRGTFGFLYTDQAGMFGGGKRTEFTQVKRALKELGIFVLTTSSAEAKGRIERLWGTLQDRLVPELRLAGVTTHKAATEYFNEVFLPKTYNQKFKLNSEGISSAYRSLPKETKLEEIFYYRRILGTKPQKIMDAQKKRRPKRLQFSTNTDAPAIVQ